MGNKPQQALEETPKLVDTDLSAGSEAAYWLLPVKSDKERTPEEIIQALVGEEEFYAVKERTSARECLKPGDWICFYAIGKGVVAHARVISRPEKQHHHHGAHHPQGYSWGFRLDRIQLYLDQPVVIDVGVRSGLDCFRYRNPSKPWGWFVKTMREITEHDFNALTRPQAKS